MMSLNMWIRYKRDAVTCPWEVWERLPDGRSRFVAAYQTQREAVAHAEEK